MMFTHLPLAFCKMSSAKFSAQAFNEPMRKSNTMMISTSFSASTLSILFQCLHLWTLADSNMQVKSDNLTALMTLLSVEANEAAGENNSVFLQQSGK